MGLIHLAVAAVAAVVDTVAVLSVLDSRWSIRCRLVWRPSTQPWGIFGMDDPIDFNLTRLDECFVVIDRNVRTANVLLL